MDGSDMIVTHCKHAETNLAGKPVVCPTGVLIGKGARLQNAQPRPDGSPAGAMPQTAVVEQDFIWQLANQRACNVMPPRKTQSWAWLWLPSYMRLSTLGKCFFMPHLQFLSDAVR